MLGKQVHSCHEGGMELEQNHGHLRNVIGMISLEKACIDITLQRAAHAAIKSLMYERPDGCPREFAGMTRGVGRFSIVQVVCIRCL